MAAGEAVRAAERTARQGEAAGRVRGTGARSEDPGPGRGAGRRPNAADTTDTAVGADTVKAAPSRRFSRRVRKSVNSLHVVASVGLVGVEWGLIALGIVARVTGDAELRHTLYPVMRYLVYTTGMPLAVIALVSGILLCLRTPWGLWRYLWIKVKIVLLFLVIAIGAGLMSRWLRDLEHMTAPGADAGGLAAVQWYQFAGAAVQLAALAVATFLSIFKPAGAAKGSAARRR